MTTYLLAGGGTAGHVNPLLALADLMRVEDPDAEIIVLGTREGLEARLVPERGYELSTIERLPFPRRLNRAALRFPFGFVRAVREIRAIITQRNVDVIVGFGGYASAPAYRAGRAEKVPVVIHEANAKPGLANKLGALSSAYVGVTFPDTPIRNARVTGMPLRPEITTLDRHATKNAARAHFGLDPEKPTLLVTGGSLGARAINEGISSQAAVITDAGAQVLHVWGGLTEMKAPEVSDYTVIEYCDRMDLAFAASDLVVSRAGSTTVSELAGLGIPAILVPYGHGNGEQRFNAAEVVAAGGAKLVPDEALTPTWVQNTLIPLLTDPQSLATMSEAARSVGRLDGTERLLALVTEAVPPAVRSLIENAD